MEKTGQIEIKVTGSKGNVELKPDTYDIKEIISIIEQAEKMLFPGERRERPLISYSIEEGSVKNIFRTSMQVIIGFSAVIVQIQNNNNIDFLELDTAKAIESLQEIAIKKNYTFEISTSIQVSPKLKIDSTTYFYRTKEHWAEAEFYFYGKITNAGGKDKANIHLVVEDLGTIIIQTPQEFLAEREENLLYRFFAIRTKGKQNTETGDIDTKSLTFLELIDYDKHYDEIYLKNLRDKARTWLSKIDPDDWLKEIRGYDA